MSKKRERKTYYIDDLKFIAIGHTVKNSSPKILVLKTDVRGQLNNIEYKDIRVIKIKDETYYKVKYQMMVASKNEDWYFEIL